MRKILCAFFSFAMLASSGCRRHSPAAVPSAVEVAPAPPAESPPPAVTPPVVTAPKPAPAEPAPPPKAVAAPSALDVGELNFQAGNYGQAIRSFEDFLSANPKSKNRDQALFHLGLSHALANDTSRDMRQAEAVLKRLITEFPNSPYKNQAEFILGLQAQIEKLRSDVKDREDKIKRLSEELQKLKEIDLQRRPSHPPE